VRIPAVDRGIARALAVPALVATAVAAAGQELHGRPTVTVFQMVEFSIVALLVVGGLRHLWRGRAGWFSYFLIALAAIWEGLQLLPTLWDGFVLTAVPAFAARTAAVVGLGCGVALLPFVFRIFDQQELDPADGDEWRDEDEVGDADPVRT